MSATVTVTNAVIVMRPVTVLTGDTAEVGDSVVDPMAEALAYDARSVSWFTSSISMTSRPHSS